MGPRRVGVPRDCDVTVVPRGVAPLGLSPLACRGAETRSWCCACAACPVGTALGYPTPPSPARVLCLRELTSLWVLGDQSLLGGISTCVCVGWAEGARGASDVVGMFRGHAGRAVLVAGHLSAGCHHIGAGPPTGPPTASPVNLNNEATRGWARTTETRAAPTARNPATPRSTAAGRPWPPATPRDTARPSWPGDPRADRPLTSGPRVALVETPRGGCVCRGVLFLTSTEDVVRWGNHWEGDFEGDALV